MFALAYLTLNHTKVSNQFLLVCQMVTIFTPIILELLLLAVDFT